MTPECYELHSSPIIAQPGHHAAPFAALGGGAIEFDRILTFAGRQA
jgi:hypothetical protein